jgi:CHAT domain-containing protein
MRALLPLASLLALAACATPPPEAFTSRGRAAAVEEIGPNARNEACRMLRAGGGAEIFCGEWDGASARVREVPRQPLPALAAEAAASLASRLECEAPRTTAILGGQPAALLSCRRRVGGWPAFALVADIGGRGFVADGVLAAAAPAERAIGVLSGRIAADAAPPRSAALDLLAARLAREAVSGGDHSRFEQLMAVGRDANQAERFAAAETAYRAALALQERLLGGESPERVSTLLRLALQVSNQGRFPEAEALLARGAALAPRASDPLARAQVAHYRGLHEANRGRTEAALARLEEAAGLYARGLPPELRLGQDGPRAADQGLSGGGLFVDPLASRALAGTVEVRRNRAAVLRAAGRVAEAEAEARRAERLAGAAPGLVGSDIIAARLARTGGAIADAAGSPGAATRRFAASAARFARAVPRSRPHADTLLLEASAAGVPSLALCREAVAILRELREGTRPEQIAPCVHAFALASGGSDQGLLAEGFEALQLGQGSVTATQISQAAARLAETARNPAVAQALQRREATARALALLVRQREAAIAAAGRGTNADIAALDARIEAAEAEASDADQAVQAAAPGFAQLVQSVAPAAETLAALAPGEALIAFSLAPGQPGWTFLLRDGRIHAGRIGATEAEVNALVARTRAGVEDGSGGTPFDAEAAHALHRALFAGVAEPFAGARRLVVAPVGQLLSLPFGVLAETAPPAPRGHENVAFLIERVAVAHVPAPSSFVALRRAGASRASQPWFGFGDARPVPRAQAARSFPNAPECGALLSSLPALPTAGIELRASASLMGTTPAAIRAGAAFTADAVRRASLRDYRILHFATHGLLPGELSCVPEAAIVASAAPGAADARGALVTASTVLTLDLDADAVILSACNSGGGAAAGESLSGLARAFFFSGARSLLVTHWYVDDVAATRIIALSLRNRQQGAEFADALRAAQLDFKRNVPGGSHPALWAAFALVGPGPGTGG